MVRKAISIILSLIILVLAGCSSSANPAPSVDKVEKKTSIAMLKLTSSAPIFIGIEKGFFKEQGIDLDIQWFQAAQPIAVATASNKVDIGATGITAGLYNMVAGGQNLSIVADKGREQKGYSSSAVLVSTDLWKKGVKKVADLKGKKIGITQTGSTFHYMIGRLLEENGLSLNDVELVQLTKISALMESLKGKQIDAVILNEPNITKVIKEDYGKLIIQVGDVIDYQTSAVFYSPDFLKDKEKAIRFMKGYIKSTRYYYDAVLTQKDGKIIPGQNYDEVVNIIAKYTETPTEDIKFGLPYMDRDGRLLEKDIQTQMDWYVSHKLMDKPLAVKIVDTSIWEEAYRQLGN